MGLGRAVRRDRRGRPSAVLVRRLDGTLASAAVRTPGGAWVSIEPRADVISPWGPVDRLWLGAEPDARTTPLTVVGAVDWERVTTIPPLAEPSRLPSGAGTAVLNLLATLAHEQGVERVTYRGPYPTEALFLALLESFRPDSGGADPLGRFMANDLAWIPDPFAPSFEDDAYLQWRNDRIEKVVRGPRTYYREDWGPVRRTAPLRVHDEGAEVACSLWALGRPLARHLTIDANGVILSPAPARAADAPERALPRVVRDGLVALVIAQSAPALATALRAVTIDVTLTTRSLPLDLAAVDEHAIRVADVLVGALRQTLGPVRERRLQAELALAALADVAGAVGDALRLRAQAWLVAAPPDVQASALGARGHDPECAQAITAAVAAMVTSGGMGDQPDVEGDEAGHRDDRQHDVGDP